MTVRPTLNKFFEIAASSVALQAIRFVSQQLEKNSLSEDSAFAC